MVQVAEQRGLQVFRALADVPRVERLAEPVSYAVVEAIRACQVLGIRAGHAPHRIIGIWAVVVERRVFVRSWSLKPRSWYRTFLEDPRGLIEIAAAS